MRANSIFIIVVTLLGAINLNAQSTWNVINSGTTKKLNTIDFPTPLIGYIGGDDSLLLKTTDGGRNWTKVNYSGITFYPNGEDLLNIKFIDENVGFLTVGPYTGSYKTINGGLTWTPISGLSTCFNQALYFFDENNGFIAGSGCFQGEYIDRLSSGTWSQATVNTPTWDAMNYIVDMDFYDSQLGLAVSKSGYVLRTQDGGATWDTIPGSVDMNSLTGVRFVDQHTAYASYIANNSLSYGLYKSTDGGLSWQNDFNSATFFYPDFLCLHVSGNNTLYSGAIGGDNITGLIFESTDPFDTWNYATLDYAIRAMSSYQDSVVFAVGDNGYIVVNKDLNTLGLNTNILTKSKIFPVPATDKLYVQFEEGNMKLTEYLILGTDGRLCAKGQFLNAIDLSGLKPGSYFLEILNDHPERFKFIKE